MSCARCGVAYRDSGASECTQESFDTMQPDGHSFRVLTYNILARSLGSNTIPWVLNVSPQTRARIEDKTGEAFGTWRRTAVDEEYKRHWHKNFHSGDYAAMRALWGAEF